MKVPKKYLFIALILLVALLVGAVNIQIIDSQPDKIYERAKNTCPTEIWIVEKDAVWVEIRGPIKQPYPAKVTDVTGELVLDFACDQAAAEQKK